MQICPSFTAAELREGQRIGYWGALGDSVLCDLDGRQYIVCSTAVRQKDDYLVQRIRSMMAHALASFATYVEGLVGDACFLVCCSWGVRLCG